MPIRLLRVSESDSDQEIKRAYRKEMSKHHPDKLAARWEGCPHLEMMEMAKEKTQRSSRPGSGSARPAAFAEPSPTASWNS